MHISTVEWIDEQLSKQPIYLNCRKDSCSILLNYVPADLTVELNLAKLCLFKYKQAAYSLFLWEATEFETNQQITTNANWK